MAYGCCFSHFPADPFCGPSSAKPMSAHGMLSALLFYPALSAPIIPLGLFVYILLPGTFSLQHLLPSADFLPSGLRHNIAMQERSPHLPQTRQSPHFLAPPPLFSMPSLELLSGYLPIIISGLFFVYVVCVWSPMAFASSCCQAVLPQRWPLQTVPVGTSETAGPLPPRLTGL